MSLHTEPVIASQPTPEAIVQWPPSWRVGFGTKGGAILAEATQWSKLAINLRLSDACDVSLSCSGRDIPEGLVVELVTDLWAWLGDDLMFRGRVTGVDDSVGEEGHRVAIRATDYRGLLDRRILLDGDTLKFTGVPQAEIAWSLIAAAQGHQAGSMGITRGIIPQTRPRDRQYEAGQTVGELVDNLSDVLDGFDYEVDPLLRFNVYYPTRGKDVGAVLDYRGTVSDVDRKTSTADYANYIRHTGGGKTKPAKAYTDTLADGTAPEGRWEAVVSDPDLKIQATVQDRANRVLNKRQKRPDRYDVTITPGQFALTGIEVGDWANLRIECDRLNVNERVRVNEVAFDVGDSGEYTTKLATTRDPLP